MPPLYREGEELCGWKSIEPLHIINEKTCSFSTKLNFLQYHAFRMLIKCISAPVKYFTPSAIHYVNDYSGCLHSSKLLCIEAFSVYRGTF